MGANGSCVVDATSWRDEARGCDVVGSGYGGSGLESTERLDRIGSGTESCRAGMGTRRRRAAAMRAGALSAKLTGAALCLGRFRISRKAGPVKAPLLWDDCPYRRGLQYITGAAWARAIGFEAAHWMQHHEYSIESQRTTASMSAKVFG